METTLENYPRFFGGDNNYLVITGKYIWHPFDEDPFPIPTGEDIDITEGRYYMFAEDVYMLAKLQWGDKWWNGSKWTAVEQTFQIPYMKETNTNQERRADATIFQSLDFRNTVSWRIGTDEKGYCIPVPTIMTGVPKLTLYKPVDPRYNSSSSGSYKGEWYWHKRVFLKNFDIKAVIGDPTYSDVNNSDTKYEAVLNVNDDSVNEMDEIEYKICTYDNKNPNYSSVCYKEDGEYHYVTTMEHYDVFPYNFPSEEILVKRLCKQYENPMCKLELQLDDVYKPYDIFKCNWVHSSRTFVIDSQSKDYYNNTTTITLVEKGQ